MHLSFVLQGGGGGGLWVATANLMGHQSPLTKQGLVSPLVTFNQSGCHTAFLFCNGHESGTFMIISNNLILFCCEIFIYNRKLEL